MNYYEYSGSGISNNSEGAPVSVPTIGSILVIDPAYDLGLDSQYSNGSGGQYNMQFSIDLYNQGNDAITPTIYMVTCNGGIFTTENGASSFTTGLLNQEMVLETKSKDAVMDSHSYNQKVVGGSIENLGSIHKHLKSAFSKVEEKAHEIDDGKGHSIKDPVTGSGMSAGGMSAGAMKKRTVHKYQ